MLSNVPEGFYDIVSLKSNIGAGKALPACPRFTDIFRRSQSGDELEISLRPCETIRDGPVAVYLKNAPSLCDDIISEEVVSCMYISIQRLYR